MKKSWLPVVLFCFCIGVANAEEVHSAGSDSALARDTNVTAKRNGLYGRYDKEKKLIGKYTYKDNELEGPFEEYYDNNIVKSKGQFVNGKAEGELIYNDRIGRKIRVENYKNGKLDGPFKTFYKDGTPKVSGYFKDNKLNGLLDRYNKKGKKISSEYYKDGKLSGIWTKYDENGNVVVSASYTDGYLAGNYKGRGVYKNGKIYVIRAKEDQVLNSPDYKKLYEKYIRQNLRSLHGINGLDKVEGKFFGGKFSGKIEIERPNGYAQSFNFKDGVLEGKFEGKLDAEMLAGIENAQFFRERYREHDFIGRGFITNGEFDGKIDSHYTYIDENGKKYSGYCPYVEGEFKDGRFTGYIANKDHFYTYYDGELHGPAFDKKERKDFLYNHGEKTENDTTVYDCDEKRCEVIAYIEEKLNRIGPWSEYNCDDIPGKRYDYNDTYSSDTKVNTNVIRTKTSALADYETRTERNNNTSAQIRSSETGNSNRSNVVYRRTYTLPPKYDNSRYDSYSGYNNYNDQRQVQVVQPGNRGYGNQYDSNRGYQNRRVYYQTPNPRSSNQIAVPVSSEVYREQDLHYIDRYGNTVPYDPQKNIRRKGNLADNLEEFGHMVDGFFGTVSDFLR